MDDWTNGWMDDGTDGWNDASWRPLLYVIIILFYFTHTYCRWHSGHHQALGINRTEPIPPSVQRRRKRRSSRFLIVHYCWIPDGNWQRICKTWGSLNPMESEHCQTTNKQPTPPPPHESSNENVIELMLPWRESEFVVRNSSSYIGTTKNMSLEGKAGWGWGVVGCGVF
jgi:hypothetical protein